MGPRSCERGKFVFQFRMSFLEMLQWGRVRVNAERDVLASASWEAVVASMGPRSCERGKH